VNIYNLVPKKIILVYHSFCEKYSSVPDAHLRRKGAVPVDLLESHLNWLSHFADFVSLGEIVRPSSSRGWKVAVTLDDGYRNNIALGLPVFEEFEVPVTWFVNTEFVESDDLPWWDLVAFMTRVAQPTLAIEDRGDRYIFDLSEIYDRECFRAHCKTWFQKESPETANRIRHQIEQGIPGDLPRNAFASRSEVVEASQSRWLQIGGHTVSHPNLALLSDDDARREIIQGKEQLEKWTGQPVKWFAYPYGGREHWNERTKQIVYEAGFRGAVTTIRAYADQRTDRFEIPRLTVPNTRPWKMKAWVLATNASRELYRVKQNWVA